MKKNKLLLLVAVLGASFLLLVACGNGDDATEPETETEIVANPTEVIVEPTEELEETELIIEPTEEVEETEPATDLGSSDMDIRNVANYWVELNGARFSVGQTVADFEDTIFEVAPHQQDSLDGMLSPRTVTSLTFQYQTAEGRLVTFTAGLINPWNEEISMRDALVSVISLDEIGTRLLESHVLIATEIQINETTKEDIIALFGEADDIHEGPFNTTLMYQTPDWGGFSGSSIEFTFPGPDSSSVVDEGVLSAIRIVSYDLD